MITQRATHRQMKLIAPNSISNDDRLIALRVNKESRDEIMRVLGPLQFAFAEVLPKPILFDFKTGILVFPNFGALCTFAMNNIRADDGATERVRNVVVRGVGDFPMPSNMFYKAEVITLCVKASKREDWEAGHCVGVRAEFLRWLRGTNKGEPRPKARIMFTWEN